MKFPVYSNLQFKSGIREKIFSPQLARLQFFSFSLIFRFFFHFSRILPSQHGSLCSSYLLCASLAPNKRNTHEFQDLNTFSLRTFVIQLDDLEGSQVFC